MRTATFLVVLAIHAVFFLLFALRSPLPRLGEAEAPSIAVFLPTPVPTQSAQSERPPEPPVAARTEHPTTSKRPPAAVKSPSAVVKSESDTPSGGITPTPTPDWRQEAQIAANHEIEAEERRAHKQPVLAPHDFSGVRPGSTDDSRPKFAWNHAATHRVEEIPAGGLLININDRCAIVWIIFPFPGCKIGKIPARADLFDHLKDAPVLGETKVP
jgi:type IV secretory pathway VirB10-like protein